MNGKSVGDREHKAPSIRKNYAYNLIYQVMALLTPFITTPYISRVLGADGVGVQSYTNSVAQYFIIFAALGTASYGQREIARNRDDRRARSRIFWEIELLCAGTTALCVIIWGAVIGMSEEYAPFYAVLTMNIIAVAFDISWFFGGLERYGVIALRNIMFKLLCIVMMFLLVRRREDLLIYMGLIAATTLLGNLSMWGALRGEIERPCLREIRPWRHLKETLVYFVPTIATSVYTMLDKTMLGWYTGESKTQNGYYEYATGFINMAKVLILSFNAVMSARMSYLFAEENRGEIREKLKGALDFVLFLAIPMVFGMAAIAPDFVPWFLGAGYEPVVTLMYVCCPLILIVGLSDYMGSQILTPAGRRAESGKVIVAGAAFNFALNLVLIPRFKAMGAAAASVMAEIFITSMYFRLSRDYLKLSWLILPGLKRLAAAFVMYVAVVRIGALLTGIHASLLTALEIGVGTAVYFALLCILRDDFLLSRKGFALRAGNERTGEQDGE